MQSVKFPYRYRKGQTEIIKDIEEALENGAHIVLEAPTGSGKTIATLYPTVKYALKNDKKIFYLVHTNSQELQVIKEAKKLGITTVALQGRANLCPLSKNTPELRNGSPDELALLCNKLKKDVINGDKKACPYYSNYISHGEDLLQFIKEGHSAEEIFDRALNMDMCAYEAIKDSLSEATILVFPYIYFFYPFIRRGILDKLGLALSDIILIIDEAHNIPQFARDLKSLELTINSLEGMEKEARYIGNPNIFNHSIADIGEFLKESIFQMEDFVQDGEGLIPRYVWEEKISNLLEISVNDIEELSKNLIYYGEMVREEKIKKRKLPRSHIYHVGNFLYLWKNSYSYEYIRIVKWEKAPSLEIYCLDPMLVTEILLSVHSSIHISGTLQLEEYKNIVGLPKNTVTKKYPWPFPQENLKILYTNDVTTKYGEVEENIEKYTEYIEKIISLGKNTVIFFPSYSILSKISENIKKDFLKEDRGMKTYALFELVENFKREGGSILSVIGGRIFEGLNFPGKQLEIVVIVGIPYPKPTPKLKALEMYYQSKFGNGWDYAFRTPALIKMRQAIGRLIRTEDDRGIAVILDKRAASFKKEIPLHRSNDIIKDIKDFFKG